MFVDWDETLIVVAMCCVGGKLCVSPTPHQVISGHREGAPRHLDVRAYVGPPEVGDEFLRLQRGTHQHHLELAVRGEQPLHQAEQEVCVEVALVDFVDDQVRDVHVAGVLYALELDRGREGRKEGRKEERTKERRKAVMEGAQYIDTQAGIRYSSA